MKTFLSLVIVVVAITAAGADIATQNLQRGLFEEEANHDLKAAIQAYEAVVAHGDEQRKVIATAIFRLGECYRKLNKTNEAQAYYSRIVRDFSDQRQLVELSRKHALATSDSSATTESELTRELERRHARLLGEFVEAGARVERIKGMSLHELSGAAKQLFNDTQYQDLQSALNSAQQETATLEGRGLGPDHTELRSVAARIKRIRGQMDERIGVLVNNEAASADLLRRQLTAIEAELARAKGRQIGVISGSTNEITQAEAEELARVKALARNSPDLLQNSSRENLSELQRAARDGHYSVVEFILAQKVNPNGPEHGSSPPLLLAAQKGHLRIVQLLLEKGADVNSVYSGSLIGPAALPGQTALMSACESGFRSVVDLLLERGANVEQQNDFGMTCLHYAAVRGRTAIAELLLKRGSKTDVIGRLPLLIEGWPSPLAKNGATPLHFAVQGGYTPTVELLLKSGASVNITNSALETPLHVVGNNPVVCALLLEKGANPNAETREGYTPLLFAIPGGRTDIIELLLSKGADVNRQITWNLDRTFPKYPVHVAISKSTSTLRTLLAAKPDLEVTNASGVTPLWQAVNEKLPEAAELLLAAGADPNKAIFGVPPILGAAQNRSAEIVRALLKHGANPNVVGASGYTPLSAIQLETTRVHRGQAQIPAPGDSNTRARYLASLSEIEQMLREHGASENISRFFAIDYTRPAWTDREPAKVFYRGTNDYNRYTLFEILAETLASNPPLPFPDLANVTIERIDGTNAKPRELAVNVEAMFNGEDCEKDIWLQWGDRISIPELDHPLNQAWPGLPATNIAFLHRCLTRHVQIIVKNETNTIRLERFRIGVPGNIPGPARMGTAGTRQAITSFRLKDVVYSANVLRASSDPTRVRVTRRDAESGKTTQWVIDLTKVQASNEQNASGRLWFQHDLWLRNGDLIEIPDR